MRVPLPIGSFRLHIVRSECHCDILIADSALCSVYSAMVKKLGLDGLLDFGQEASDAELIPITTFIFSFISCVGMLAAEA